MVKVCRTPTFSRGIFSANELSGWADGIAYTPSQIRERKQEALARRKAKQEAEIVSLPAPPVERLEIGISL